MAYHKSKARIDFEQKSNDLLKLAQSISYKKVKISYNHKNLTYQATIVLLSSAFEEYLRTMVEDMIYQFRSGSAKMSALHPNIRTYVLLSRQIEGYKGFLFNKKGEKNAINNLSTTKRDLYAVLDDNQECSSHISAREIINGKKFPSPENLIVLYNRLGISNIFDEIGRKGRKDYKTLLDIFNGIRSTIAHTSSVTLTIVDINRWIGDISDVINKLDRVLFSHCCKYPGGQYWPS